MTKKAFITGITGQDGSYLVEFLVRQPRSDLEVPTLQPRSTPIGWWKTTGQVIKYSPVRVNSA
jgi:hypothetical protein